jgi:hypothetical protein
MISFSFKFTTIGTQYETVVVWSFALCGVFGASFVVALASDVLALIIPHMDFVHSAFSRLWNGI